MTKQFDIGALSPNMQSVLENILKAKKSLPDNPSEYQKWLFNNSLEGNEIFEILFHTSYLRDYRYEKKIEREKEGDLTKECEVNPRLRKEIFEIYRNHIPQEDFAKIARRVCYDAIRSGESVYFLCHLNRLFERRCLGTYHTSVGELWVGKHPERNYRCFDCYVLDDRSGIIIPTLWSEEDLPYCFGVSTSLNANTPGLHLRDLFYCGAKSEDGRLFKGGFELPSDFPKFNKEDFQMYDYEGGKRYKSHYFPDQLYQLV
ncbi:MAG: hypothetical protein WCV90_04795 [Candidatus Woesearchaeota archaeon]|jgi:hypothetical protein